MSKFASVTHDPQSQRSHERAEFTEPFQENLTSDQPTEGRTLAKIDIIYGFSRFQKSICTQEVHSGGFGCIHGYAMYLLTDGVSPEEGHGRVRSIASCRVAGFVKPRIGEPPLVKS